MEDEKPKDLPVIDHLKLIADLKAALEDMPDDPYLKNALALAKQVPRG